MQRLQDSLGLLLWLVLFSLVVCFMASILLLPMLHDWLKNKQPNVTGRYKPSMPSSPNTWTEL